MASSYQRWPGEWLGINRLNARDFDCGNCGARVGSQSGYPTNATRTGIWICGICNWPNVFREEDFQWPSPDIGAPVKNLPGDIAFLYDEARNAASAGAFTAAVMVSRKLLMNVAVAEGAPEGKSFVEYVNYLESQGMFSPNMRDFVDAIRKLGNDANHKVAHNTQADARNAITFIRALLHHNYELPGELVTAANP